MKKYLLLLLVLSLVIHCNLRASHIVGGEFELVYLNGYNYQLNLIQYFDDVNGEPGAEDVFTDVYIYSKADNQFMQSVRLFNSSSTFVPYTNPECSDARLITRRIFYTAEIQLLPTLYNNPEGYYVVYERCCRNYTISNLANPRETGQTFYMEFPAVNQGGKQFIDSTPVLFPPLSDYACVNELFYFDFRGSDADGDSLSYRLSVPLNSTNSGPDPDPQPTPSPSPHPLVEFAAGVTVNNMVSGNPALTINKDGFLTVRPNRTGLFVFAVTVDEFRNGKKIGQAKRDFQMLVIDCDAGTSPTATGQINGRPDIFSGISDEVIYFGKDDDKCMKLFVTDPDSPEKITIKAIAVNFEADMESIIPTETLITSSPRDTLEFEICLPDCPLTKGPAIIDLLVMDDACSLPLMDTLRLVYEMEDSGNKEPYIVNNKNIVNVNMELAETYELVIEGKDDNKDVIFLDAQPDGFSLDDYDMSFRTVQANPGEIKTVFQWNADCAAFDFSEKNEFDITFLLTDETSCPTNVGDSMRLHIQVNLPENHKPNVYSPNLQETSVELRIGEILNFALIGEDIDNDDITLEAIGQGFELADYGINFQNVSGNSQIGSSFNWRTNCDIIDLQDRDLFQFLFVVTDQNICGTPKADTLTVNVQLLPPDNNPPVITVRGSGVVTEGDSAFTSVAIGNQIFFNVIGTDEDNDIVSLNLTRAIRGNDEIDLDVFSFNFTPVRAVGRAVSQFFWIPSCIFLESEFRDSDIKLEFVTEDEACFNTKSDTITVVFNLTDKPLGFDEYLPPNVFTPNTDEKNEYFWLPNLPAGNCANQFEEVHIFNRWGVEVFASNNLEFRWYGTDAPTGVYYYQVKYSQFTYKGTVSVIR